MKTLIITKKEGRTSEDEITMFDSTGLAIQDISRAYAVYKTLNEKSSVRGVQFF